MTKLRIFCFLGRARKRFRKLWASTLSRCKSNVLYLDGDAVCDILLEDACFHCMRRPTTLKVKRTLNRYHLATCPHGPDELTFPWRQGKK